jgi:hypothetical protein
MTGKCLARLCASIVCRHSIVARSNRPTTSTPPGARPRARRTALTLGAETKKRAAVMTAIVAISGRPGQLSGRHGHVFVAVSGAEDMATKT